MRGWVDFLFFRGLIVVLFVGLMAWLAQDWLRRRVKLPRQGDF